MQFTKRETGGAKGADGLSPYLKLKDGESATGVFRGDIYEFYQIWPRGGQKQVFQAPTPGATSRFKINFVLREDSKFIAKIFEIPIAVYNQLAEINSVYPLSETKVKITRSGEGTSTSYIILPLLKEPIPAIAMKEIEQIQLNILNNQSLPSVRNYAPTREIDEVPF